MLKSGVGGAASVPVLTLQILARQPRICAVRLEHHLQHARMPDMPSASDALHIEIAGR